MYFFFYICFAGGDKKEVFNFFRYNPEILTKQNSMKNINGFLVCKIQYAHAV